MKLLLLLIVGLVGAWWWRSAVRSGRSQASAKPPATSPQDMVACSQCGLHVPRADALQGERGLYCSREHRQIVES